jgi:hypothetical protein
MTPAGKAKQLVHRFYLSLPNNGGQTGLCNVHQRWNEGKICALIAIDEIIEILQELGYDNEDYRIIYQLEVKQEIEKI